MQSLRIKVDGWSSLKFYHLNRHEYPMYRSLCDFVTSDLKRRLTLRSTVKDGETPGSPKKVPADSPKKSGEQLTKSSPSGDLSPKSKSSEKD